MQDHPLEELNTDYAVFVSFENLLWITFGGRLDFG